MALTQAYDVSKQLIYTLTPNRTHQSLSTAELATAGFLSAVPTTLVTAPVERAKVLLQVQGQGGGEVKYKGVTDVLKHLYKEGGVKSIYRGTGATLARDGPGSAACVLYIYPEIFPPLELIIFPPVLYFQVFCRV